MSSSIASSDLSVRQVFQDYYVVPNYQRDYVWGENADEKSENEVELFLGDIHKEFELHSESTPTEYFIGTIITCANNVGSFDVIDGQQRLTTIFIIICAIRDALNEVEADSTELAGLISQVSKDSHGKKLKRNRLELQYTDSGNVLETIVVQKNINEENLTTRSTQNLYRCYQTVREFISSNFGDDKNEIDKFEGYFLSCVKLIRVTTPNLKKALTIFATINDRGVGLDAMDLLKNLMFINTRETEYKILSSKWKNLADTIYSAKEKPLRFLRYFILSDFAEDNRIREDDAYIWFQRNEKKVGYKSNPTGLVERLIEAAEAYENFRLGNNAKGEAEPGLLRIKRLGGSASRQPYILLLSGRHLKTSDFSELVNLTENLSFLWFVTRTASRDTEPAIVKLSARLRKVDATNGSAFEEFVESVIKEYFVPKSRDFSRAMVNLHYWDMPKYRVKYVLGKITQFVEQQAYNVNATNLDLESFLGKDVEIEHILAQNPSEEAIEEFGVEDTEWFYCQALGNLLLLDKSRNVIATNKPYSEKIKTYAESGYMLSQYLSQPPKVGKNDRITKAHENHLISFKTWSPASILERQKMLTRVAHEVWEIPMDYKELPDWDVED